MIMIEVFFGYRGLLENVKRGTNLEVRPDSHRDMNENWVFRQITLSEHCAFLASLRLNSK